jgi:hypothetical protein
LLPGSHGDITVTSVSADDSLASALTAGSYSATWCVACSVAPGPARLRPLHPL